ncbi:MAG: FAD-dependent oxidoreductase [Thermoplasmata archaeon]
MSAKKWDYSGMPGAKMFPNLFKPIKIRNMTIPNRIKYAATEDNLNARDGTITPAGLEYMRLRARGVVGGICMMQGVYMDPKREGQGYVGQAAAWDDKFIPGLTKMAEAINNEGAVSGIQLMHCGRVGGVELDYCVGPSAVPQRLRIFRPVREMSKEDIKLCIKQHANAARRGVQAGFQIMEISGIVGYLISNFLSAYTNRRKDEYGGDIEGRCRFMVETIEAVRDAIGKEMPLIIRLCAEELLDEVGGNTPEESIYTYKVAERAGVDCISVTQGWQESNTPVITRDIPQGTWLYNAKRAKEAVKVPISMAYRLFDPAIPNKAIGDGILDIWEMCRPMIADPLLPLKVLEGRLEDIRPCVACNLCLARLFRDAPMTCYVNPVCSHEWDPEWQPRPAEVRKKIIVAGAGPAGLEFAHVAASRGHEVHVHEKLDRVGGQLWWASKGLYGDEELWGVVRFQEAQCKKAGVHIHLKSEVTPGLLDEEAPDALVVATGARYIRPKVPGEGKRPVFSALDVLEGREIPGERVVVWGGRKPGISAALLLAEKGKRVTMVFPERKVGKDVNPSYIWRYIQKLGQKGVKTYKESSIEEITDSGVVVRALYETRIPVEADAIVYAEREPVRELEAAARERGIEVQVLGDAIVPRSLSNAIHDGYRVGIRI